jgi:tRNA (guanine-N7-)-methyltransferase
MTQADNGIRSYVLRQGRMTDAQKRAFDGEGARYLLPFEGRPMDFAAAFGKDADLVMEIGFGMGQATWRIAAETPERNFLGVEVHRPGVGKLLSELVAHGVGNVRIINHDAVEVMEKVLAPDSLAGIHLFYPDPWPKKRHHKRRILRPGLAELMVSRLRSGGYLYFVTDIEEYAESSLALLSTLPNLRNRFADFAPRQEWRPETKFEARALKAGGAHRELVFERV